ncbi:MAG: MFS transporter [Chthoniobacterales bacterium]|nr:MFS transporter [Chthoniobacterales bacterium]
MNFSPVASKKFFYPWAIVFMLWSLCFLNYADRQVLSVVFPVLEKTYSLSKFQLGMIGSIFMWVYAGSSFFAGYLTDRFSRKGLILTGCFFWSIVAMATGWCSSFWQFWTVRGLEGLGESVYFPASNSMISDAHPEKNRSKALSWHQTGVYFGTIAGSWGGAFLAQHYHWSYGFFLFGGLGVVLSLLYFFFLKEPNRTTSSEEAGEQIEAKAPGLSPFKALKILFSKKETVLIACAFICANFVGAIYLTWLPTFLYEKFHMQLTKAGLYSVLFIQLTSGVVAPFMGWVADALSIGNCNGRLIAQIGSLLVGSTAIFMIGNATTVPFLIGAMILMGACKAGYDVGIFSAFFDYIDPSVRGSAVGLMNTFGWVGGALGPMILGAIVTYGGEKGAAISRMSATISCSALAYVMGAVLLLSVVFLNRKSKKAVA